MNTYQRCVQSSMNATVYRCQMMHICFSALMNLTLFGHTGPDESLDEAQHHNDKAVSITVPLFASFLSISWEHDEHAFNHGAGESICSLPFPSPNRTAGRDSLWAAGKTMMGKKKAWNIINFLFVLQRAQKE